MESGVFSDFYKKVIYKGKPIYYIDYSGLTGHEICDHMFQAATMLMKIAETNMEKLLLCCNFSNIKVKHCILSNTSKESLQLDLITRKEAHFGISGIKRILSNTYSHQTLRKIKNFQYEFPALDWLVS